MAKLSVVVPFYNVEGYLQAALESVARQTLRDLEVIMVDDGSTDGSAAIAKDYASRDARFTLIQQANAGLGPARNTGFRRASGEYLAFFDGDDLLDPHAYDLLTGSLEKTGSDIAAGGCRRLSASGSAVSWLHDEPFRKTRLRTHVSRFPLLLRDRTAWNKVFRRSFWDAHGFEFPPGMYEDGPVTIPAHVLASSVDVLQNVVYYWRMRDAGALSITQRAREIGNVEERIASISTVARFLTEHAPALKPAYDATVLKVDMHMLTQAFEFAADEDRARIAELAASYLGTVDAAVYREVSAALRLQSYLLGHQMLPELLEFLRYRRRREVTTAVRRDGPEPRWLASYPFLGDPARGIPDDIYDLADQMTLNATLDQVCWRDGKLCIEGYAYIRWLSSAAPSDCQIRVSLHNSRTRRTIRLPVTRVRRPDVTARSGQPGICYDWSGFATEVNPGRLATLPGLWRAANWELLIEVNGSGLHRKGPVSGTRPGPAQWPEGRWVARNTYLQPASEQDGRFVIRGQQVTALVTRCTTAGGAIEIQGWTSHPLAARAKLTLARRKGGAAPVTVPAEAVPAEAVPVPEPGQAAPARGKGPRGRHGFRARIPVRKLVSKLDTASPIDRMVHVHDEFLWDAYLVPGEDGQRVRLAITPATAGARLAHQRREVTVFTTAFGSLSLLERTVRPVVTGLEWTAEHRLAFRGDYSDPGTRPAELILRHVSSGREFSLPLSWDGNGFTSEFSPGQMSSPGGPLPLASGGWHVLALTGPAGAQVAVAADRQLLPDLVGYHRVGLHEVEAQYYQGDALRLNVRLALSDGERGRYALERLRREYYPQVSAQPVRELAVFDSFGGRQFSCNPRAIYEELRRERPDLDCAWVTADGQFTVPAGTRIIPMGGREHFEALAQARYVIVNDELPDWFRKRDGQVCMQTWHGTPLKRIGLDIARPQFASAVVYPELLRSWAAQWDVLLSPNAFSSPIFRRALGYDGEILECGYPRNDPLFRPDHEERAAAVRRQLGLPPGKRVILYAPTWRDNAARHTGGGYRFDLELDVPAMAEALSGDHVLLLRLHTNNRHSAARGQADDFVLPVTDYPDITDLLLVTDVLITDYSSIMFDFAGTGRPILFFTYDLDTYRDSLRGFYFDFQREAPGPLLGTTSEVITALRDIDAVRDAHRDAYRAFAARYCYLDDGKAAARAVQRLLGSG